MDKPKPQVTQETIHRTKTNKAKTQCRQLNRGATRTSRKKKTKKKQKKNHKTTNKNRRDPSRKSIIIMNILGILTTRRKTSPD